MVPNQGNQPVSNWEILQLAAIGVATRKPWSKPLVWTMGVLIVAEWLVYTLMAYRRGVFQPGSWVEFCIALAPGVSMASVSGYCCYVVDAYVVRHQPSLCDFPR